MANLALDGVALDLGGVRVLQPISTAFARSRVRLVLGANGSGKSVLLLSALGLIEPTEGRVTWNGRPLQQSERQMRRRTTTVFQRGANQILGETVRDDLQISLAAGGVDAPEWPGRIAAAAKRFGLEPWLDRSPQSLSGGFQQRLVLAAATIASPDILFLDEPLLELDYCGRTFFVEHLTEQAQSGMGLVIATHNYRMFWGIADEVLILVNGTAVFDGRPEAAIPHITRENGLEPW